MGKKRKPLHPDAPLLHPDHPRPTTRRDFLRQGFIAGTGTVLGGGILSLFANPREAMALSSDILTDILPGNCRVGEPTGPRLPIICFDLAGGASMAGSNVLCGGQGGQLDLLSTAGYSRMGIPGDLLPVPDPTDPPSGANINNQLGLLFHEGSQFKAGIVEKAAAALANINGALIAARSDNDTANNPHNPMYAIAEAFRTDPRVVPDGTDGGVISLIGSRNSDSGGNSVAPPAFINPELRPAKVDRPSDVTGMVDIGNLTAILDKEDVVAAMESMVRLTHQKLNRAAVQTGVTRDAIIKDLIRCGYISAADLAERFGNVNVNPAEDADIVENFDAGGVLIPPPSGSAAPIFTTDEFRDAEFRKTASVMKMVVDGHAGAGTITMGGYDYHTGDRTTGEARDLRAGRCMGACLDYARRRGVPLMLYVFSDGSVFSNGDTDSTGKGVWTGDNSGTAGSFILLYDPKATGRPVVTTQQIGWYSRAGAVVTSSSPAANNVNQLVHTVLLNYMKASGMLEGGMSPFFNIFNKYSINHGLGDTASIDSLTAFNPIV